MAGLCGLLGGLAVAAQARNAVATTARYDFDFLMGSGRCTTGACRGAAPGIDGLGRVRTTNVARPLLGGIGPADVYRTEYAGGFTGMSFLLRQGEGRVVGLLGGQPARRAGPRRWWVRSRATGDVRGRGIFEGRPIRVRFIWSRITTATPRWEQAFSTDGGKTWETNWVMDFARREGTPRRSDDGILTNGSASWIPTASRLGSR